MTNDTFSTVLKLMEEFPEFCLSQSQASTYDIVRKYNPEIIRAYQAAGGRGPVGGGRVALGGGR